MTTFRGFPACECLAAWLPVYEAELQRRGVLFGPLPIFQLIGNAPQSAGVHSTGGAFDITDVRSDVDVEVARKMGADATWSRTAAQGFVPHIHGVLRGCPHNGPARFQIEAVDDGFNGLGLNGRGGLDDGPRPLSGRTWQQGIRWAQQQQEDDMSPKDWTDEDWRAVRANLVPHVARAVWMWAGFDAVGTRAKALLLRAAGRDDS